MAAAWPSASCPGARATGTRAATFTPGAPSSASWPRPSDGTLSTRFVPEMMPATGPPLPAGGALPPVPAAAVFSCRLVPDAGAGAYGLLLRADEALESGYRLTFDPQAARVALSFWPEGSETRAAVDNVEGLGRAVDVVVCMKDSVIDVCVNNCHTLVERRFDRRGTHLGMFAEAGGVRVEGLRVVPLV